MFNPNLTYGTLTDIDGNVYKTIEIGSQTWMAENLKTTRYANGDNIPLCNTETEWDSFFGSYQTKAYCWYDDDIINKNTYGALYTWGAAMNGASGSNSNPSGIQGACPTDWHLPSYTEWVQLETFIGGSSIAGGNMKETDTIHWVSPNEEATNEYGFTALPAGIRETDGKFAALGSYSWWWTSRFWDPHNAWEYGLLYYTSTPYTHWSSNLEGLSIRCVKN